MLIAEWVGILDSRLHFLACAVMITVSVGRVIIIANVAATISDGNQRIKKEKAKRMFPTIKYADSKDVHLGLCLSTLQYSVVTGSLRFSVVVV